MRVPVRVPVSPARCPGLPVSQCGSLSELHEERMSVRLNGDEVEEVYPNALPSHHRQRVRDDRQEGDWCETLPRLIRAVVFINRIRVEDAEIVDATLWVQLIAEHYCRLSNM